MTPRDDMKMQNIRKSKTSEKFHDTVYSKTKIHKHQYYTITHKHKYCTIIHRKCLQMTLLGLT